MNLNKGKRKKWDVNQKVTPIGLKDLMKEIIEKDRLPSELEFIDFNKINPYRYKPEEFYQIKYNN